MGFDILEILEDNNYKIYKSGVLLTEGIIKMEVSLKPVEGKLVFEPNENSNETILFDKQDKIVDNSIVGYIRFVNVDGLTGYLLRKK